MSEVPIQHYEQAMALSKHMKVYALAAATSADEQAKIVGHWPWDDTDDVDYR